MPVHHWRIREAWLERLATEVEAELARLRRTARLRLGRALLEAARRPWRPLRLLRTLVDIARQGPAKGETVQPFDRPPYPLADWATAKDAPDEGRLGRALSAVHELTSSPSWMLGSFLLERRHEAITWPLARRRQQRDPAPLTPRLGAAVGSIHTPALPVRLRCAGPAWFTEMLAFEGVSRIAPSGVAGNHVLVGLSPASTASELNALEAAERGVAWVLDGPVPDDWLPALRRSHRVFVAEPTRAGPLGQRLERRVEHLAPAVAPRLDNPIGCWSGRPEVAVHPRAKADRPTAWEALAKTARGLALSNCEEAACTAALGTPLPTKQAPAWASASEASDWQALVRLRTVIQRHDLATRLRAIGDSLTSERSGDIAADDPTEAELVTIAFSSNRPERQRALLEQLARQTHPHVEVVGALHGDLPPGHLAKLERHADMLGLSARFVRIDASRPLGYAVQAAFNAAEGATIARVDDDDVYFAHYIEDMALALRFSEAGIVFKHTIVLVDQGGGEGAGKLVVIHPGCELCYLRSHAGGGRMIVRRELAERVGWRPMPRDSDTRFTYDCLDLGAPLMSADRFNHVFSRGQVSDHTWRKSFETILRTTPHRVLPPAARPEDFDV